ncbi:hypothetical protein Tco_1458781 [Tanacetum coccineum]
MKKHLIDLILSGNPTGRIFKSVGLRWIPTGKSFDSCTSKVDSEPIHGSNVDIPNIHENKQTMNLSADTSINVQKEQSLDLSAGTLCNVNKENLRVQASHHNVNKSSYDRYDRVGKSIRSLFDEYFNGVNLVVSKSSAVTAADAPDKRQQQPDSISSTSTLATTVTADGNFDVVKVRAQVDQGSQIKMIQVKEMMQDNDLKNSKSKDKGSKSRSQSMDEQSHYKQDKTITRQSINVKRHIFNVIGGTEEFEERDLNIGGDC